MDVTKLIESYEAGKRDFEGANLSGVYLSGVYLSGADLFGANLSEADLSGADLRGADLRGANLFGANLFGANLFGANLPAPTMVLLAQWGAVPNWLCVELMRFDAENHERPGSFQDWVENGPCPYNESKFERSANFTERRRLYTPGPAKSAITLAYWLLLLKTQQNQLVKISLARRGLC